MNGLVSLESGQIHANLPAGFKVTKWELLQEYFAPSKRGQSRKWEMWRIVNAILHVTRAGSR